MRICQIVWLDAIVEKIAGKHAVDVSEVEEVLQRTPLFLFVEKGKRKGEDVYMALGTTEAGRYLAVLFIYKNDGNALVLSARDMADRERKRYGRK
uniref:BrnT family toxin n=1 Tax=Anaerolinea thermolimosa TaxID=229919 RepID=A0A7C4KJY7_9CHLR